MGWNWLASLRMYLPPLPRNEEYDPFSWGKIQIAGEYSRRGNVLFSDGDYDAALAAFNEAIQLYNSLLDSKFSDRVKADLALALNNRSCVFLDKSEYDLAIPDCDLAITYRSDFAPAFTNRGTAYLGKGDPEKAIRDYDQANRLDANLALALSNRGFARFSIGRTAEALSDVDRAIELAPTLDYALRNRGAIAFCRHLFAPARKDFAAAKQANPSDCNSAIWLYLASTRDEQVHQSQLEALVVGVNLSKWPGPAVQFLLGSMTREQLLASCNSQNPYREREQRCSAHCFIGQSQLLNGDAQGAANSFSSAIESSATNCLEYVASEAELRFLAAKS